MGDELTPMNFIEKIKAMDNRERAKIPAKKLIDLICQSTVDPVLDDLRTSIKMINQMASTNKTLIDSLTAKNDEYVKMNACLVSEVQLLKIHAQECKQNRDERPPPPPPQHTPPATQPTVSNADIDSIRKEIDAMKDEINSIQQYLRVNNLEVVGLPETNTGETEETLLVNALNQLVGLEEPIRPEDIDISHPLNSQRKDGKPVHVVRFISRKTKQMILNAKKTDDNKEFKFRNKDVYINEHLSKHNRALFASAQEKKRLLNYRFCWTRGGSINMRKSETSEVISISNHADLNNLR